MGKKTVTIVILIVWPVDLTDDNIVNPWLESEPGQQPGHHGLVGLQGQSPVTNTSQG